MFVLGPGQVLHINKGRLHAFRKLAFYPLPESDCHWDLRNQVLEEKGGSHESSTCLSVAWDWMFKGVTRDGINNEVSSILECSRINQKRHLASLAVPETCLLFLAKENIAKHELKAAKPSAQQPSLFAMNFPQLSHCCTSEPDAKTVLRGILPSLQSECNTLNLKPLQIVILISNFFFLHHMSYIVVVNNHKTSVVSSERGKTRVGHAVTIDHTPNSWRDPSQFPLDAFGIDGYYCKICAAELSNIYYHCDGCENLLKKDFNICSTCHIQNRYQMFAQMHPFNQQACSIQNHTGDFCSMTTRSEDCSTCSRNEDRNLCLYCKQCTDCSCQCHTSFTLHYRFFKLDEEIELVERVKQISSGITETTDISNDNNNNCNGINSNADENSVMAMTMEEEEYNNASNIQLPSDDEEDNVMIAKFNYDSNSHGDDGDDMFLDMNAIEFGDWSF